MASLFVQDVPEFVPFREQLAACEDVEIRKHPAHYEYVFDGELTVDRKATGLRHALWYSCIAGIAGAHIAQHDKTQLRLVADSG